MLTKRIIPCLDIKDGRTVKGINFENLIDAGDPIEQAKTYSEQGADELVFLDIAATNENRKTLTDLVKRIAQHINIPFTVGGGISTIHDVENLLSAGADKISINTAAIRNPKLINDLAKKFGSQCVVLAIDTKCIDNEWFVFANGGKVPTDIKTTDWVLQATDLGVGEILLTSMNNDGTKDGFALDITSKVAGITNVPVIASGGAGNMQHFADALTIGHADAVLAASVFHSGSITIPDLKQYLSTKNIAIRN